MMRPTLLLAFALASATTATADDAEALQRFDMNVQRGHHAFPGELAVHMADGATLQDLAQLGRHCVPDHRWGHRRWVTLDCDPQVEPRALVAAWADVDAVDVVQAPFEAHLTLAPNDLSPDQWHLRNTGQSIRGRTGTPGADIGAVEAWDVETGDGALIVAVIDTGVWIEHNELSGRIHQPPGEICDNGVDDDSNGYIDDCAGWDVGDDDNDPDPRDLPDTTPSGSPCAPSHGTFIAGLVAADTDNGAGLAGTLWNARVLPIKMASDDRCALTDLAIAEGIGYALDQGASVINASWTIGGLTTPAFNRAMNEISASQTLFVIAAGNDDEDADAVVSYPVDSNVRDDLVVAATTFKDQRAGFSNWGETTVDLAAPGVNLRSFGISDPNQQVWSSGTSFAAPLVAAGATLVWDRYPMLTRDEVRASLIDGATPLASLDCDRVTKCVASGARLDLPGALVEAEYWATTPFPSPGLSVDDGGDRGDGDGIIERGEQPRLVLTITNDGHVPTGSLTAALAVTHPLVTATTDAVSTAPAPAEGTLRAAQPFVLDVPLACDTDGVLSAVVTLTDDETGEVWTGEAQAFEVLCDVDEDADGVRYPEDCDDTDEDVFPGADELCNGVDDDCDGETDEADALDVGTWFRDADGDGVGGAAESVDACDPPEGFVRRSDDCDDDAPETYPGADELCDGADNDCDETIDENPVDPLDVYADNDGDGWGGATTTACELGDGVTDRPGDCDDSDPEAYPDSPTHRDDCSERLQFLGCACTSTPTPASLAWLLLPALALLRRRRP